MRTIATSRSGFALLEYVMVFSIFSLIASVSYASYDRNKEVTNDAERFSDMNELRHALDAYKEDHGSYPTTEDVNPTTGNQAYNNGTIKVIGRGGPIDDLLRPYLGTFKDPADRGEPDYFYFYIAELDLAGNDPAPPAKCAKSAIVGFRNLESSPIAGEFGGIHDDGDYPRNDNITNDPHDCQGWMRAYDYAEALSL